MQNLILLLTASLAISQGKTKFILQDHHLGETSERMRGITHKNTDTNLKTSPREKNLKLLAKINTAEKGFMRIILYRFSA